MSGLGTTVEPTGEPGSIVSAAQERLLPETLPSNDASIAQTTSINVIDQVLNRDYVRQGTYTVSSSMPAGTVITAIKIHPDFCNYPNRHVNELFNAWTGGMKGRMRALATAWYGGDIRMGKLPPNFTEEQIYSAPLELLTAHPNESMDPKNTGWIHFTLSDQRPVAYHYNSTDLTDPNTFGGWFIIFVAGRLVTQSPDFTQIDLVLEFAGGFSYDQLAPRMPTGAAEANDPLANLKTIPLHLHPLLDSADVGAYNVLIVQPSTVTAIPAGSIRHSGIGKPFAVGTTPGLTTSNSAALTSQQASTPSSVQWFHMPDHGSDASIPVVTTDTIIPFNSERTSEMYTIQSLDSTINFKAVQGQEFEMSGSTCQWTSELTTPHAIVAGYRYNYVHGGQIPSDSTSPVNPSLIGPSGADKLTLAAPQSSGESIVTFCNLARRTCSTQTELIANELGVFPRDISGGTMSKLYSLTNTGVPLAIWRLNPNGVFTAKATATAVVYPAKDMKLTYLQDLPVHEPIPTPSFMNRQLMGDLRMIQKRAMDRQVGVHAFVEEIGELCAAY